LSIEQLRDRISALRQREQMLRADLQAIADQVNDQAAFLRFAETLTAFLARLRSSAETLSVAERQRIVRLVVKDVLVGDNTITIRHSISLPTCPRQNNPPPQISPTPKVTFCVRGVVSPMLANLYMNRFLKYWRISGRSEAFQARVINYADDFVILSHDHATEALNWTRCVMARIGLTLNEAKTSIRAARQERFDFLGYTFGPHRYKDGHWYLGASPSKKSIKRIRQKVGDLLTPGNVSPWKDVRCRLNQMLRGWSAYFCYGTRMMAYGAVDKYVCDRVRQFLKRRHKVSSRGTKMFREETVFGELGVFSLRQGQSSGGP